MSLTIPAGTRAVLDALESASEPTVDYEISGKLSGILQTPTLAGDERKGAWAEATAFNLMPSKESPWGTHYGPQAVFANPDGTPRYAPDIMEADAVIIAYWEERSMPVKLSNGAATFDGAVTGNLNSPQIAGLAITPAPAGTPVTGHITGTYEARNGLLDLARSTLTLPSTRVEFSGVVPPTPGRELHVHLETRDLNDMLPALGQSAVAQTPHPIMQARYADIVWNLKKTVTGNEPSVQYAQRAIDAYLDGVRTHRYKEPLIHAALAMQRALELALRLSDKARITACKTVLLDLFAGALKPKHQGVWATVFDTLTGTKKAMLTEEETAALINGLEGMLSATATKGSEQFDPFGAEAAARRLASYYDRQQRKADMQRVVRAYGNAFEHVAEDANPTLAMSWLQPVHDEYKNRGMNEDALRVQKASAEKGKQAKGDLKEHRVEIKIEPEKIQAFLEAMTEGAPHDALLRIAAQFIPNVENIQARLQELLTIAPLMARIGVTRIVGDHFAARAGSIEDDPEGRLIMQLADDIGIQNQFLSAAMERLREKTTLTTETILGVIDESPVYTGERRPLIQEGVQAYLDGDNTKAIHVLIPQIEQALRELLTLTGGTPLKPGRNATMQLKNLNDLLREQGIKNALGENLQTYLLTFLADQRGQNTRNIICHGLAQPAQMNKGLATQTLHALLALALVREKDSNTKQELASKSTAGTTTEREDTPPVGRRE